MKILVLSLYYAPELVGGGLYTSEMCKWLAARGHSVAVVTAYPFYPEWKVAEPYRNSRFSREVRDGVMLTRCPFYVPQNPSGLRRILSYLSFALTSAGALFWTASRARPDVVFVVAPSLLFTPATLFVTAITGARSWLHVQDFEIGAAFQLELLKGNRLKRWATSIESALLKRFDRVSTISPKMRDLLLEKKVAPARAIEFRNWVDTTEIVLRDSATPLRAQLGVPEDAVVALYSGSMGFKQGLETIVDAARLLQQRGSKLFFVICGNGATRDKLVEQSKGLDRIRFIDLQPRERLPELLATADIHLLPQRASVADLVLPSKLAPMLATGRPVIAMAAPQTQLASEVEDAGLVIPADDPEALAAAISTLASDVALRTRLGTNGRNRAECRWDAAKILCRFEHDLLGLASRRPDPA
jgi:colanic acid biosynthesis glycosyl transferase WcaI